MQRSVATWAGAGSPDFVTLTPTPVLRLPWGATRSLRTSQRPRGAAARFARLGLLLVANVETGSQKPFNNRNGLHQSQRRLHYNPTNHRSDGLRLSGPRGRQRDTVTHHNMHMRLHQSERKLLKSVPEGRYLVTIAPNTKFIFLTRGSNVQALLKSIPGFVLAPCEIPRLHSRVFIHLNI